MLNPSNVNIIIRQNGLSKIQQKHYNYKPSQNIDKSLGTRLAWHMTSQLSHPITDAHMENDENFHTWHI